ncbi:hypothetical protein [Paraburkholderia phenoliruptrix]|uniref:hypothetical protein n=1 Tax=Paraburkholderia phenoliruptrix TaxID=252970 RepID=UPI0028698919|nr:hypothetical protein [Paraburkholderia phenoliruptrix]WMY08674.1 hypothetical protein P3F88_02530 [Paraburkholderia phenoliruptrix]
MTNSSVAAGTLADYGAITTTKALSRALDTTGLFDKTYVDGNLSPIDQFIKNTNAVNLVWLSRPDISPELASIVLLGYMSAVESYMRALLRSIINVDDTAKLVVEAQQISFAAAMHHDKAILPEALLEEISFAGPDNIKKSLNRFLGLQPAFNDMEIYFNEFEKISQLRHCCTHRFGKLGTKNAVVLGLSKHNGCLEKPLKLGRTELELAADILRDFVKTLNNLIFRAILDRTATGGKTTVKDLDSVKAGWTWTYRRDRKKFAEYYSVFASTTDAVPSPDAKEVYESFASAFKPKPKAPSKPGKSK